jgi:hypothetical protein
MAVSPDHNNQSTIYLPPFLTIRLLTSFSIPCAVFCNNLRQGPFVNILSFPYPIQEGQVPDILFFTEIVSWLYIFFYYRQHDIHSEVCPSSEAVAFLLLFLQSAVSSNCFGLVYDSKLIPIKMFQVKGKWVKLFFWTYLDVLKNHIFEVVCTSIFR